MSAEASRQPHAIAASCVFDGAVAHRNAAVVIVDDRIRSVVQHAELSRDLPVHELPPGVWLAPGSIDLQVNGGGDVLFNDAPTPKTIRRIVAAHRRFGTTALLPTLISDSPANMNAAVAAVDELSGVDPGVLGIHLEGPFLSPEKAGVHAPRHIRHPTANDLDLIAARRRGVTLVTLAPEKVPPDFIGTLTRAGVRVALGHSMATYAQTCEAIAAGLTGFTHLFNAMRGLELARTGTDCRGAGLRRCVVRPHRRWRSRCSGDAAACITWPRSTNSGDGWDAASRRHTRVIYSQRR